jgi:hypothetical protein
MKEEEEGKELSSEQKKAALKYEEVVSQLAISKEFCKQFQSIANAASKEAKREARKAGFLRQMQETSKVREVVIIQDLLRQLKNDAIRNDFLKAQNGACLVEASEMNVLEQFSKYTIPIHPSFSNEPSFSNSAKVSADHFSFVVDGRTRQFMETGFTYDKIKELFQRIQSCGYFEKDIEIVEQPERPTESASPQTDCDLDSGKEEKMESIASSTTMPALSSLPPPQMSSVVQTSAAAAALMPSAPLPTQIPNPTQLFNGNVSGIMPVMQHAVMTPVISQQPAQQGLQMQTTVTAVENAFFNQMKYSQGPMNAMPPNRFVEDFQAANISFLQDSLVEQNAAAQAQQQQQQQAPSQQQQQSMQKRPPSANNLVNQPKHSPIPVHPQVQQQQQQQGISTQTFTNQTYHPQQQQQVSSQQPHHFPPGLKLQSASNIPVNIPPTNNSVQYQQQMQQMPTQKMPNLQEHHHAAEHKQQKSNHNIPVVIDGSSDKNETSDRKMHGIDKEKSRNNEWNQANNQPPQIDTWNNDTSTGANPQTTGNSNYSRFNRNGNRGSGDGARGSGGAKFNNYR